MLSQAERLNHMCAMVRPDPSKVPADYVAARSYNKNWRGELDKFLRLHPRSTVNQIAEGLGVAPSTMQSKMSLLYSAGVVARVKPPGTRKKPGGTYLYSVAD